MIRKSTSKVALTNPFKINCIKYEDFLLKRDSSSRIPSRLLKSRSSSITLGKEEASSDFLARHSRRNQFVNTSSESNFFISKAPRLSRRVIPILNVEKLSTLNQDISNPLEERRLKTNFKQVQAFEYQTPNFQEATVLKRQKQRATVFKRPNIFFGTSPKSEGNSLLSGFSHLRNA